jgi:hypothetical protein
MLSGSKGNGWPNKIAGLVDAATCPQQNKCQMSKPKYQMEDGADSIRLGKLVALQHCLQGVTLSKMAL